MARIRGLRKGKTVGRKKGDTSTRFVAVCNTTISVKAHRWLCSMVEAGFRKNSLVDTAILDLKKKMGKSPQPNVD